MMFQNSQDKVYYGLHVSVGSVACGKPHDETDVCESYCAESCDLGISSSYSVSEDNGSPSSFLEPQVRVSYPDETGNVSTISY